MPHTVASGRSSPSFLRNCRTCTSTVRSSPTQSTPHTLSSSDVDFVIVAEVRDVVRVAVVGLAPAQDGLHTSNDLSRAERFGDVVVGAQLQAEEPIELAVAGGEEQHRHVAAGAHPATHLEPVDVGEADVEQHERGTVLLDQLQATLAVRCLQHTEACVAQIQVEEVGDVRVVLDHHERAFRFGHRLMLPRCYRARRASSVAINLRRCPPPPSSVTSAKGVQR